MPITAALYFPPSSHRTFSRPSLQAWVWSGSSTYYAPMCKYELVCRVASGGDTIAMPKDMGIKLSKDGGFKAVYLQIHYNNPEGVAGEKDSSGFSAHATSTPREKECATCSDPAQNLLHGILQNPCFPQPVVGISRVWVSFGCAVPAVLNSLGCILSQPCLLYTSPSPRD